MKIKAIVEQVLKENPKQFEQHMSGRHDFYGFFLGKMLKLLKKSQYRKAMDLLHDFLSHDKNDT